jgi:hypothetical protein
MGASISQQGMPMRESSTSLSSDLPERLIAAALQGIAGQRWLAELSKEQRSIGPGKLGIKFSSCSFRTPRLSFTEDRSWSGN